jgi:hypothetical protein
VHVHFLRDGLPTHPDFTLVLPRCGQVIGKLHPQPRFFGASKRLGQPDSHLGIMPDLPVITLLNACRVTPRIFAPSEIDNPKGSRHPFLMLRPGCGGFFIGMTCFSWLVVVDQFNVKSIFPIRTGT